MSKKESVLKYLQSGRSITKFKAFEKFQMTNLGDTILQLRKDGYNIVTDMRKNKNTKSIYAVYKQVQ